MEWPILLRQRREACGLTQTELAVKAEVSLPSIQKMEAGRANPSLKTLESVFNVLGVDVQFTLRQQDPAQTQQEKVEAKVDKPSGAKRLIDEVVEDINGLTKGSARGRVNHFFKLLDKVTDPTRGRDRH